MVEPKKSAFIGTWRLLSIHTETSDSETVNPLGRTSEGRLNYDKDGTMAVQLMNIDRPLFKSDDPFSASDEELRAAFHGYVAYYGSYSFDPSEGVVTHHISGASIPNWIGSEQKRYYEFSENQLMLKTPPITLHGINSVRTLVWERL